MQLSLNWLYTRKALRSCKEKLLHVVQSGSFLLYRTLGLLYSRCQLQGRREPVWDLPLTSSVVVSSTGPSFSGLPAVADPRLRKGALVLQGWLLPGQSCLYRGWGRCRRLVAPGPVTALGGEVTAAGPGSVCHSHPVWELGPASESLPVDFEASGEFCIRGCGDLCRTRGRDGWLPGGAARRERAVLLRHTRLPGQHSHLLPSPVPWRGNCGNPEKTACSFCF